MTTFVQHQAFAFVVTKIQGESSISINFGCSLQLNDCPSNLMKNLRNCH